VLKYEQGWYLFDTKANRRRVCRQLAKGLSLVEALKALAEKDQEPIKVLEEQKGEVKECENSEASSQEQVTLKELIALKDHFQKKGKVVQKEEVSEETAISAAIFMLSSIFGEDDLQEIKSSVMKLAKLFMEKGLPFKNHKELLLIPLDNCPFVDHPYLHFLIDEGCKFSIKGKSEEELKEFEISINDTLSSKKPEVVSEEFLNNPETLLLNFINSKLVTEFCIWFESLKTKEQGEFLKTFAMFSSTIEIMDAEEFIIKVKGDNNSGAIFNFTKKSITVGKEYIFKDYFTLDSKVLSTYGLMGLTFLRVVNNIKTLRKELNTLPNVLYRDPEYGIHALSNYNGDKDPMAVISNNSFMLLEVKQSYFYPWVSFSSKAKDISIKNNFVHNGEAFVTDKNAMKEVGGSLAANAAGIGRNTSMKVNKDGEEITLDVILNNNRSDKPSKLLNGPNQFYRFLKAKVEGWEEMTWGNLLPDGSILKQGGISLKTAIVETALNPGSGPAFIRPGLSFNCSVRKSGGEGAVEFLGLPKEVRNKLNELGSQQGYQSKPGITYLRDIINHKCEETIGKVFKPGETILSFGKELGMPEKIVCSNREMNQNLKVISYKISEDLSKDGGYKADYFKVEFEVDLIFNDDHVKLRNAYIKLTTSPYEVNWFDKDMNSMSNWGGVDIMLNPETMKSQSILQAMFIMEMGGGYYDPDNGFVYLYDWEKAKPFFTKEEEIRYQDNSSTMYISTLPLVEVEEDEEGNYILGEQSPVENAMHIWAKSKIETRYIQVAVGKSYWNYASKMIDENRIIDVIPKDDYYLVTEEVRVLISNYNYEVEISTPRENTSPAAMTLQQHVHLSVVDPVLGEALAKESLPSREATAMLIEMNCFSTEELIKIKGYKKRVLTEKVRRNLANKLGDALEADDITLFKKMKELLTPSTIEYGIVFVHESFDSKGGISKIEIPLMFSALLKGIGFINGYADGIGRLISTFIRYICTCDSTEELKSDNNKDGTILSLGKAVEQGLTSWFKSILESKNIYKKMSMTDRVGINLKVRTSYHPALESKDEIPTIILNPYCDGTKYLAKDYKSVWELDGKLVGIMRVPMPMLSVFRVKLDKEVGRVAHAHVYPHLWAFNNEGDSDGDGIMVINLSKYGYTKERALAKINNDALSFEGYKLVYGENVLNHPYADFCQVPAKKRLDNLWFNKLTLTKDYNEVCTKVGEHYAYCVGKAYGIASVLTFDLIQVYYQQSDLEIKYAKLATLFAWRLMYEGLGLAGWSDTAEKFFAILKALNYSRDGFVYFHNNGYEPKRILKSDIQLDGFEELINLSGFNFEKEGLNETQIKQVKTSVLRRVLNAYKIYSAFNNLSKGYYVKTIKNDKVLFTKACMYGSLRHATKGIDPGNDQRALDKIQNSPTRALSLHEEVLNNNFFMLIKSFWLKNLSLLTSESLLTLAKKKEYSLLNEF